MLTIAETAEQLGISAIRVYQLIQRKILVAQRATAEEWTELIATGRAKPQVSPPLLVDPASLEAARARKTTPGRTKKET